MNTSRHLKTAPQVFKVVKCCWRAFKAHCHTIWRHRTGSTMPQVMACCLTTPSHCLNPRWLIASKLMSPEGNFTWNAQDIPGCTCHTVPRWTEIRAYELAVSVCIGPLCSIMLTRVTETISRRWCIIMSYNYTAPKSGRAIMTASKRQLFSTTIQLRAKSPF